MRHVIISISNSVHAITRRAAVLAVCLMFLTVMLQIIARYVFSATGLLGATLSFKTRSDAVLMQSVFPKPSHILSALGEAIQSAAVLIFVLPVVYFCFVGLRGGFAKGYLARQSGLTADTLGIPMVWISVSVPLAMIIILLHLTARWAGDTAADNAQSQLD